MKLRGGNKIDHLLVNESRWKMLEYSSIKKNKLAQKLKSINITNEKDILNLKIAELKKINESENIQNLTIKDIEIIWLMQEAIENKKILEFFTTK